MDGCPGTIGPPCGWGGAAIEGAASGEPVRTERGEVTLYSRRPLVVVIDGFLSEADAAAAVEEHDRVFDARKRDGETVCFNTKMTPAKRARMPQAYLCKPCRASAIAAFPPAANSGRC